MIVFILCGCYRAVHTLYILHLFQDLKFVQAAIRKYTRLAVISQYKRDYAHFSRRGGRVTSSVDSRVTFTAPPNAFKKSEQIVVQVSRIYINCSKKYGISLSKIKVL